MIRSVFSFLIIITTLWTGSVTLHAEKNARFLVVDKTAYHISVYEPVQGDTVLVARYPVCVGKNPGNKQRSGDHRTPESTLAKPFTISQIQNAATWTHDFGDGRGAIRAYGNYFLRLDTGGWRGIGIHGSTNNEASVPGRGSEGCVRLRDSDIIELAENYAFKGMKVIIKPEGAPAYGFEK